MQPARDLSSPTTASLFSPLPFPCHLPKPTSITSVNSHLLRGALNGAIWKRQERGSPWKPQLQRGCSAAPGPSIPPKAHPRGHGNTRGNSQQPAALPGEALGIQQQEDKGNTHARENPGAKAARDCLKTGVRLDASSRLWWDSSAKREARARNPSRKPNKTSHSEKNAAKSAELQDRFEG